ncbi:MAG: maleylpyruvate isomerase family protein [bacterium]|nr:maleylpyruvate isomerase family protein [bacterium]
MNWNETIATFRSSAEEIANLVDGVDDLTLPALGEWDLAGLIGHYLRAIRTPLEYLTLEPPNDSPLPNAAAYSASYLAWRTDDPTADGAVAERARRELDSSETDLAALIRGDVADLVGELESQSPSRLIATRFGSLRLDHYMRTRTMELVIHGLDIARALGEDWEPPQPQLLDVLALFNEIAIARGSAVDLVLALSGRTPPTPDDVLPILR